MSSGGRWSICKWSFRRSRDIPYRGAVASGLDVVKWLSDLVIFCTCSIPFKLRNSEGGGVLKESNASTLKTKSAVRRRATMLLLALQLPVVVVGRMVKHITTGRFLFRIVDTSKGSATDISIGGGFSTRSRMTIPSSRTTSCSIRWSKDRNSNIPLYLVQWMSSSSLGIFPNILQQCHRHFAWRIQH